MQVEFFTTIYRYIMYVNFNKNFFSVFKKCNELNRQKVQCAINTLNLLEFTSKWCLELSIVLLLTKDNLSAMDKQLVQKVSSLGGSTVP